MTILVTGVTGTVGSAVFRKLLADGHDVRGACRNPEKATFPRRAVRLDLEAPETFASPLRAWTKSSSTP